MSTTDNIILKQTDFQKISELLSAVSEEASGFLEEELERATLVEDTELPTDAVAMNSVVQFEDIENGKTSQVTLVYPHDANIDENKISILTPVGSALIGLRTGQMIRWPLPNGKNKQLRVLAVQQNM